MQLDDARTAEWTTALDRAKTSGFGVRFYPSDKAGSDQRAPEPFWSAVVQHCARWRSLAVFADWSDSLDVLQTLYSPCLVEIDLVNYSPALQQLSQLFSNRLPRLTSLRLSNVALGDWSSSTLARLHVFSPETVERSGPSLTQMLHILQACPGLLELELGSVEFGEEAATTKHQSVQLPSLESVMLAELDPVDMITLMQHIQPCKYLERASFASKDDDELTDAQLDSLLSFVTPSALDLFASASIMEIDITTETLRIESPEMDLLGLSARRIPVKDSVGKWIRRLILLRASDPGAPPPVLSVTLLALEDLPTSRWGLSNLSSLEVSFEGFETTEGQANGFFKSMSSPIALGSGSCGWQYPALTNLVLKYIVRLDAYLLLRMLERRVDAATAGAGEASLARLDKFDIVVGIHKTGVFNAAELESGKEQLSVDDVIARAEYIIEAGRKKEQELRAGREF